MKWYDEYTERVKRLCWEEEDIPLDDVENALDIVHDSQRAGGPKKARQRLEAEHGINPEIFKQNEQ